ncbi:MAG: BspA family leucine-rich repeat surface protein [Clostridia bacterium]|nr:BspA family leucine-rich repeat surface protein [Clostridia bacterium]
MKNDIFISYRRDGGDITAMYIYQALKERGYDVFYDLEVLRAGKFNEALLESIRICQDFVLVLSPHALDRCSDENDWVRKEIAEALRLKKNIVPILLNGFVFPEHLPQEIDDIRYQNGLSATTEYFQESMNRLCSRYLKAKPHKKKGKAIAAAAAGLVAVLAVFGGWFFLARPGKGPQAQPVAGVSPDTIGVIPSASTPLPTEMPVTEKPLMISDNLPETFNNNGNYGQAPVFGNQELTREQIRTVTFLDSLEAADENAWDVSAQGNRSVLAWTKAFGQGHDLYIAGEGGVTLAPADDGDYSMFAGYVNAIDIRFNGCVDTSLLTSMQGMFDSCAQLKSLDLTGWDTSQVVMMAAMFNDCEGLREVVLPDGFVTKAAGNLDLMFRNCLALEYVNTVGWDTSNVESMVDIFASCNALVRPDTSGWALKQIQNRPVVRFDALAEGIPYQQTPVLGRETLLREQVASITFLPARAGHSDDWWDVSAAGDDSVWAWTETREDGLVDLYIGGDGGVAFPDASLEGYDGNDYPFFTGYVKMEHIEFNHCVDFSAVLSAHALFEGCEKLLEIDLSGMDFSRTRAFSSMFVNCSSLRRAILPALVGKYAENLDWMFGNCTQLAEIDMTGWDTSGLRSAQDTFNSCISLAEVDLSGWDTSRLEAINGIFEHCTGLERVNVSNWNTSRIHNMAAAFAFCGSLTELDLSGWDTSQITDMSGMFQGCHSLTTLDRSGWVYHPQVNTEDMFLECYQLQGV